MADSSSLSFNNNDKTTTYNATNSYREGGDAGLFQVSQYSRTLDSFKNDSNSWDDALQKAFNYFGVKGGTILLGAAIYPLSPFSLPPRITIRGAGRSASILQQLAGTTGNFITFTTSSLFSSLLDLTVDGNKTNCPSGGDGVFFQAVTSEGFSSTEITDDTVITASSYTYIMIQNILLANTVNHGMEINYGHWGTYFKNIFTYGCGGHGIFNKTTDIFFDTIQAEQSGLSGVYENGKNNRWSNVKAIWNGHIDTVNSAGFKLDSASRSTISNIECQDNYCDGMQILNSSGFTAFNIVLDANGRIYGQADPTDGSMAGNTNNCGLRVTSSSNFKLKGIASCYKYPNCYIQQVAVVCDNPSGSYEIDLIEVNQHTAATTLKSTLTTGGTAYRPTTGLYAGKPFFDTTLNKPIWLKQVAPAIWVDATGTQV